MSDQPTAASGESDYVMTPDGSNKKPSLFGKLKDKTRKAGSKIKSKVKKNHDDGTPVDHDGEDEEDTASDEGQSPTSSPVTSTPRDYGSEPSRFSGAKDQTETPDISGLNINEPSPAPQEPSFGEPEHKSFNEPKPYESAPPQDSFQESPKESFQEPPQESSQEPPQESFQEPSREPSQESSEEPSVPEKASGTSQGAKDALYGGAAATAGALGYGAVKKHDEDKPVTEKASDATSDLGNKAGEVGDRGYDAATDTKDTVAEQTKDTFGFPGGESSPTDKAAETTDAAQSKASETTDAAGSKAYEAKDAVAGKGADLNNATDDSETYTEKASKSAQAAKESAAGALGLDATSEGPSMVEKAKQTLGFDSVPSSEEAPAVTDEAKSKAADTTDAAQSKASETADVAQSKASETTDAAQSKAYDTKDAVQSKAADVNNATDDSQTYTDKASNAAQSAKDSAAGALGIGAASEGPSLVEKAKQAVGSDSQGPSVVDTAKNNLASTVDTTKAYAANATGTAQDYATQTKDTAVDTATPKQEDKALSEKITETLGALPGKAQETAASVTQSAKSPTTTTPGTLTDAPAAHSGEPASPGILGKLGGLFGYGAKAPEHHDTTTTPTNPTQ